MISLDGKELLIPSVPIEMASEIPIVLKINGFALPVSSIPFLTSFARSSKCILPSLVRHQKPRTWISLPPDAADADLGQLHLGFIFNARSIQHCLRISLGLGYSDLPRITIKHKSWSHRWLVIGRRRGVDCL